MTAWLDIRRGDAPLVVSFPHTGVDIPAGLVQAFVSPWLARKDADWWVDQVYDFAPDLGATTIRTRISRSVIDVNRNPDGTSLYPGQTTTELCPTTTFDGEAIYKPGCVPSAADIATRTTTYFAPYHHAIVSEIARLRAKHQCVILYDAHSIRSEIPRLFDGILPHFNLGTNDGATCAPGLSRAIETRCAASEFSSVANGRFKGGWITRHYGAPAQGIHAVQMELALRTYMPEPTDAVSPARWPVAYDPVYAASARTILHDVLKTCIDFALNAPTRED